MKLKRNYRVVAHKRREYQFAIHEIVTAEDGRLLSVTERPVALAGMSVEELLDMLEQMLETVDHPALDYDLFPAIECELSEAI